VHLHSSGYCENDPLGRPVRNWRTQEQGYVHVRQYELAALTPAVTVIIHGLRAMNEFNPALQSVDRLHRILVDTFVGFLLKAGYEDRVGAVSG